MKNRDVPGLIKELRNKLGLTQEQFAQKVGVTFSTINPVRRHRAFTPTFLKVIKLLYFSFSSQITDISNGVNIWGKRTLEPLTHFYSSDLWKCLKKRAWRILRILRENKSNEK